MKMSSKNVAIITARGGSKRIPRKNIKEFCGKPVMAYSIEAAIASGLFDEVMVSTDDEEIAAVGEDYGAKVPFFRSVETSNDYATTRDVLLEVLKEYEIRGRFFDNLCCLYPVAPFITPQKLDESYQALVTNECDAVIPMVKFSVPPQTGFFIKEDKLEPYYTGTLPPRSQDMEAVYYDPGQFYWHKVNTFFNDPVDHIRLPYLISELEAQDVDNEEDWEMAEIKFQLLKKKGLL